MRLKGQKRRIQGKKAKAHRVVILCAEGKQKAHTAVVIPSYAEKGKQAPHTKTNSYQIFDLIEPSPSSLVCGACFPSPHRKG